jgi:hypothetical protein
MILDCIARTFFAPGFLAARFAAAAGAALAFDCATDFDLEPSAASAARLLAAGLASGIDLDFGFVLAAALEPAGLAWRPTGPLSLDLDLAGAARFRGGGERCTFELIHASERPSSMPAATRASKKCARM